MKYLFVICLLFLPCGCLSTHGRNFQSRIYPGFSTSFEVESTDITSAKPKTRVATKLLLSWDQ